MRCQFCNKRCRLLKPNEADYHESYMIWLCENHSNRVLHWVQMDRYKLRRDHDIQGVSREWTYTTVSWVNDKMQLLIAYWHRYDKKPAEFSVNQIIKGQHKWEDRYNDIFDLETHPKDFTPENIAQKIATLVIFS